MNNISINKCVSGAWDLATKNWIMCIIVLVVLIAAMTVSGSSSAMQVYDTTNITPEELGRMYAQFIRENFNVSTVIIYIVQFAVYAGLYKMAINGYNGQKVDFSAYKMPFATYAKFIAASIAYGILTTIGTICCIIPGIIIGVRLIFTPVILLDEPETDIIEAFKKSWAMTSGNFWSLLGLGVVGCLINVVGLICCCVGIIFTYVMVIFMMVIAYYQLKDNANDFGQPVTEI